MQQSQLRSAFDPEFHNEIKSWFEVSGELFVVVRYAFSAGLKDFLFFRTMVDFESLLKRLPSMADVIVFKNKQLPHRGIAGAELLSSVLKGIAEGEWWLLLAYEDDQFSSYNTDGGRTHDELRAAFEEFDSRYVAVGLEPPYSDADNPEMQSGLIPMPDGSVRAGVY